MGKPAVIMLSGNPLVIYMVGSRDAEGPALEWTVRRTPLRGE